MKYIYENPIENENIGRQTIAIAQKRHSKADIVDRVVEIYNDILGK